MQYGNIVGSGGRKRRRPSAMGARSRGQLLYQVQQSILDRSTEAPLQVRDKRVDTLSKNVRIFFNDSGLDSGEERDFAFFCFFLLIWNHSQLFCRNRRLWNVNSVFFALVIRLILHRCRVVLKAGSWWQFFSRTMFLLFGRSSSCAEAVSIRLPPKYHQQWVNLIQIRIVWLISHVRSIIVKMIETFLFTHNTTGNDMNFYFY